MAAQDVAAAGWAGNVIQTVELTKVYKDFWRRARVKALDGLNLEVTKGEVVGLLGPNGSGKSTTVRLILGLLFPTRGLVRMFGRSPNQVDVKKLVGYMPEESHLYEYLNAEETLDFFGRLFGLTRSERRRRTDALLEMVGLERARRRALGEFSKGMARRIGLAQALVNDPDLLILDEPTTGLDPLGAREIKDLIVTLKKRGKTVLLCSHLLADVEQVCDKVCILYGGQTRAEGRVSDLLSEQERLEIRMPKLPEPAMARVRDAIRQNVDDESQVEYGVPSRRLEEYFMSVVTEARRSRLDTAGAEAGGPAAEFLAGEPEGEDLVERLVEASLGQDAIGEPAVALQPVSTQDSELIDGLVTGADRASQAIDEAQPAVPQDSGGVRHDLIDELVAQEDQDRDEEDEEP